MFLGQTHNFRVRCVHLQLDFRTRRMERDNYFLEL